jgi:MFS family permease
MGILDMLKQTLALSDNVKTMAVQSLVTEACFGMFYVVWQPYLIDLRATIPQLGLVQGVITLSAALGSLLWGRLSDAVGRKPVYTASFVCRFIAMIFCLTARSWISFIGFGAFIGLSAAWMQSNPAGSALLTESVDEIHAGTAISVYISVGVMASIVTAPLGGYLAMNQGYRLIFLSCLVGELFNIVFVSRRLRETLTGEARGFRRPLAGGLKALADFIRPESILIPFYVVSILDSFSYRLSSSLLYGLLVDSYGFNTVQLGLMSTAFGVSWGLSQIPLGRMMDRYGRKRFLLLSQVAAMLVMAGYILSRSFIVFLVLQSVSGLSHAMWIPAYIAMVAERVPGERRSSVLGKLSTLPQLFGVPAPYIGGVVYEALGFGAPMMIRLIALLLSFLIIFVFIDELASKPKT